LGDDAEHTLPLFGFHLLFRDHFGGTDHHLRGCRRNRQHTCQVKAQQTQTRATDLEHTRQEEADSEASPHHSRIGAHATRNGQNLPVYPGRFASLELGRKERTKATEQLRGFCLYNFFYWTNLAINLME
jgi:hypothetical protein